VDSTVLTGYRLSEQQQRLWRLHGAAPDCVYRTAAVLSIRGPIDAERFRRVWSTIVQDPANCVMFRRLPGMSEPVQTHHASPTRGLDIVDASGTGHAAVLTDAEQRLSRLPIDWERGPLRTAQLLRRAADHHHLVVSQPAICGDAGAMKALFRRLAARYANDVATQTSLSCGEYSDWQRQLRASDDGDGSDHG